LKPEVDGLGLHIPIQEKEKQGKERSKLQDLVSL
jgi:hypothetical protein